MKHGSKLLVCCLVQCVAAALAQESTPEPKGVAGDTPGCVADGQAGRVVTGINSSTRMATTQVAAPERIRVSQAISREWLAKRINPAYPQAARKGRVEGNVVLHAIISKAGDISAVDLVCGHPLLAPAAIEAVKQWKCKPYLLNGKAVEVDTQIQVNFMLTEN